MQTLPRVSHEHHDRLWQYVRRLDELSDCVNCDCLDTARLAGLAPDLQELRHGLTELLLPHMEAVEAAVWPTLETLFAERETTAPMAREHVEIRRLVAILADFADHPEAHTDRAAVLTLRRALMRLYYLLKTHLAEEELYIPILEDSLTPERAQELARALDHVVAERL